MTILAENQITTDVYGQAYWLEAPTTFHGFVRSSYYAPGDTAQFSIDWNAPFTGEVWRLGWYGGGTNNARRVATITGTPTDQPAPAVIPNSNNALTCAAWTVNADWQIPVDAEPGAYHVLFRASPNFGRVLFFVNNPAVKRPVAVVSSDATWMAAYNHYGGKASPYGGASLYGSTGAMAGGIENRSLCVSYDRPVVTHVGVPQTYFMNAEYPLIRFLERFGFDYDPVTCEQIDADPTILDGRELVVFAGHNEYISQRIWDKFRDLHNTDTRMINLTGNDFFWRTRHGVADHTDLTTHGRVMWCRKDTMTGPGVHVGGTPIVAGDWGGTWQDTRWAQRVEWSEQLWGDLFISNGVRHDALKVPAAYKSSPFWRDCPGIQALTEGQTYTFGPGSLGMEWDIPAGNVPKAYVSETTVNLTGNASDINGQYYNENAIPTHKAFLMSTEGGGAIFNGANCQHSWLLADGHVGMHSDQIVDVNGQQSFMNLLADFGVEVPDPATVTAAGLTVPTPVALSAYGLEDLTPADLADLEAWINGAWVPVDALGWEIAGAG